jgi:hypothetical protein
MLPTTLTNSTIIISGYKNTYAHLNGAIQTRISKFQIALGFLSIGKTHWKEYVKSPGKTFWDFMNYWSGLERFLIQNPRLRINEDYINLDRTEKTSKSYLIGMGISKIVAGRVLKVPYLQHVDGLVKQGVITLTSGTNERGDLVGLDQNMDWHVMEAKGRTNQPSKGDRTKAKTQAEKIATINGIEPKTKSYCITHINEDTSEIFLTDPNDTPIKKVELSINKNDFIKVYYDKLFKDFYELKQDVTLRLITYPEIDFSLFRIQETNFYIGLENKILQSLRLGNTDFIETLQSQNELFYRLSNLDIYNLSIGIDRILLFQDNEDLLRTRITRDGMFLAKEGLWFLE